ncbi:MAG: HU family DNA-binding protein [Candidatus Omnitrophica bacterium]|nr:HU family DNA-binding protein [Candidatus Omnitrophota bacterium]MCK5289232.1 HU family DNA-binding protein [Candidatus Omnitrophota bacterium]
MNKAQLIDLVAEKTVTKKDAIVAIDTLLNAIKDSLKNEEDVSVSGFGTFKVKTTKARTGRNPKTGESIEIPSKKKVSFKASKDLKTML